MVTLSRSATTRGSPHCQRLRRPRHLLITSQMAQRLSRHTYTALAHQWADQGAIGEDDFGKWIDQAERARTLALMWATFPGPTEPAPSASDTALVLGLAIASLERGDVCALKDFVPPYEVNTPESCAAAFNLWCEIAEDAGMPPDMWRQPDYRDEHTGRFDCYHKSSDDDELVAGDYHDVAGSDVDVNDDDEDSNVGDDDDANDDDSLRSFEMMR